MENRGSPFQLTPVNYFLALKNSVDLKKKISVSNLWTETLILNTSMYFNPTILK